MCIQPEADYRPLMTDVVQSLVPLVRNPSSVSSSSSLRFQKPASSPSRQMLQNGANLHFKGHQVTFLKTDDLLDYMEENKMHHCYVKSSSRTSTNKITCPFIPSDYTFYSFYMFLFYITTKEGKIFEQFSIWQLKCRWAQHVKKCK